MLPAGATEEGLDREKLWNDVEAAEVEILERRIVVIPAKDWEAFEAWAQRPPQTIAARAPGRRRRGRGFTPVLC